MPPSPSSPCLISGALNIPVGPQGAAAVIPSTPTPPSFTSSLPPSKLACSGLNAVLLLGEKAAAVNTRQLRDHATQSVRQVSTVPVWATPRGTWCTFPCLLFIVRLLLDSCVLTHARISPGPAATEQRRLFTPLCALRQVEDMLKRSFLGLHAQKAAPRSALSLARCAVRQEPRPVPGCGRTMRCP